MIYQCYHRPEHLEKVFQLPAYRGFGLEPDVNPRITRRCPELADARTRKFLNEYGAMLHLWRNRPFDLHRWIGFTSYRQLDKTPVVFQTHAEVGRLVREHRLIGWGFHDVSPFTRDGLTGAAAQLELAHPGGFNYLATALKENGLNLPERFSTDAWVLYANYWAMEKKFFRDFMDFSWPVAQWCLRRQGDFDFVQTHERSIGFIVERLFIVWYMTRGHDPHRLGPHPLPG